MDQREIENWKKVKAALKAAGKTDCMFYKRAAAIASGGKDLLEGEWFGVDPTLSSGDQV